MYDNCRAQTFSKCQDIFCDCEIIAKKSVHYVVSYCWWTKTAFHCPTILSVLPLTFLLQTFTMCHCESCGPVTICLKCQRCLSSRNVGEENSAKLSCVKRLSIYDNITHVVLTKIWNSFSKRLRRCSLSGIELVYLKDGISWMIYHEFWDKQGRYSNLTHKITRYIQPRFSTGGIHP